MKRVITHAKPDGDAIVAVWLIERLLFTTETVEVAFVPRSFKASSTSNADAVVDVGRVHDPVRLIFDHKPPAFPDRNQTCATRLVWDYLLTNGKPIAHLSELVHAVQEGDRFPRSINNDILARSLKDGFHARLVRARQQCKRDFDLYRTMRAWLDHSITKRAMLKPQRGTYALLWRGIQATVSTPAWTAPSSTHTSSRKAGSDLAASFDMGGLRSGKARKFPYRDDRPVSDATTTESDYHRITRTPKARLSMSRPAEVTTVSRRAATVPVHSSRGC